MKTTVSMAVCAIVPALLLAVSQDWTPPSGGISLKDVKVSRQDGIGWEEGVFTMADRTFRAGYYNASGHPGTISFLANRQFSILNCSLGVNDDNSDVRGARFELLLDGELKEERIVSHGDKPMKLSLDVSGSETITIKMTDGVWLAEPYLLKGKPPAASGSKPGVAELISPSEGAILAGEVATLKWKRVENAVSYSIVLVCAKLLGPVPVPDVRTWTWTVSDPTCTVPIKDLPAGEYLWSVVAFGKEKPLGGYSAERLFKIER